jgi:hypothetical protein
MKQSHTSQKTLIWISSCLLYPVVLFFFLWYWGLNSRPHTCLGRRSTVWATLPIQFIVPYILSQLTWCALRGLYTLCLLKCLCNNGYSMAKENEPISPKVWKTYNQEVSYHELKMLCFKSSCLLCLCPCGVLALVLVLKGCGWFTQINLMLWEHVRCRGVESTHLLVNCPDCCVYQFETHGNRCLIDIYCMNKWIKHLIILMEFLNLDNSFQKFTYWSQSCEGGDSRVT